MEEEQNLCLYDASSEAWKARRLYGVSPSQPQRMALRSTRTAQQEKPYGHNGRACGAGACYSFWDSDFEFPRLLNYFVAIWLILHGVLALGVMR